MGWTMAKRRKMVHVVEMEVPEKGSGNWEPTAYVGFCREDARRNQKEFKENNPSDSSRIRKYYSEDEIIFSCMKTTNVLRHR